MEHGRDFLQCPIPSWLFGLGLVVTARQQLKSFTGIDKVSGAENDVSQQKISSALQFATHSGKRLGNLEQKCANLVPCPSADAGFCKSSLNLLLKRAIDNCAALNRKQCFSVTCQTLFNNSPRGIGKRVRKLQAVFEKRDFEESRLGKHVPDDAVWRIKPDAEPVADEQPEHFQSLENRGFSACISTVERQCRTQSPFAVRLFHEYVIGTIPVPIRGLPFSEGQVQRQIPDAFVVMNGKGMQHDLHQDKQFYCLF